MPKRIDPSDRVVDYFMSAPVEEAVKTFNTIKRILFNRQYGGQSQPVAAGVSRKRRAKPDAQEVHE